MERTFRIPLRVVFYIEEKTWIAHCLEFDLCGDGTTKQDALQSLAVSIRFQLDESLKHDNRANLFSPAPGEIHERFFAGKHTATGEVELVIEPMEPVIFEGIEYREYTEDFSDSDCALVIA